MSDLVSWLLCRGPTPSLQTLRAARLAPYAYIALTSADPLRRFLRPDYVASLGRHQHIKVELQPLLAAWRDAGVDALLFKGFQLSEFVYPHPGARFHGDVDILIRPAEVRLAQRIAIEAGWHSSRPVRLPMRHSHCAFTLSRVHGATRVDVHQEIIHGFLPWHSVQRRITEAVWSDAQAREWSGVEIREPSSVDMLLVGLILQRSWGAEAWQIKPHDLIDFKQITQRFDVTRDALWARARVLRCERTLAAYLDRCDPVAGRLNLSAIPNAELRRLRARAFGERGPLGQSEINIGRALSAPFALPLALRFAPTVWRVRAALHRHEDLRTLMDVLSTGGASARPCDHLACEEVVSGVHWAQRIVGSGAFGASLVRAIATFIELKRRSFPVDFVTGVRWRGSGIVGHAWLEYPGGMPWEMDEPETRVLFKENFRVPSGF